MAIAASTYLTGEGIASALVSGIHRVIDEQEELNRINVFPVADGDTGTNLSLSLGSALAVLSEPDGKPLGTLLASTADALLDGARGNSGAIIAQFFQGVSDSAGELSRFTTYTFSKAVSQGSEYAHDALSEPREGTILSVIEAFASSVRQQAVDDGQDHFGRLLDAALQRAREALAATPSQLEVLKEAGVVDAGAKGFVALVAGMAEYLRHGRIAAKPDLSRFVSEAPIVTAGGDGASRYRFCTECIVTGTDINRRKLRETVAALGDSLVLAGTKRKAKIHIHTDEPDRVFTLARDYGEVSAEKADDMRRQQSSSHDRGKRFAVITDSAADIADRDLERLDIHIVPIRIQFGNRGYLDKVSITSEEFYRELQTNPAHPTTSQPAPGDFRRQFQFLASHFSDVISINLSNAVSGTFEAARSAAERVNAHGRVHVDRFAQRIAGPGPARRVRRRMRQGWHERRRNHCCGPDPDRRDEELRDAEGPRICRARRAGAGIHQNACQPDAPDRNHLHGAGRQGGIRPVPVRPVPAGATIRAVDCKTDAKKPPVTRLDRPCAVRRRSGRARRGIARDPARRTGNGDHRDRLGAGCARRSRNADRCDPTLSRPGPACGSSLTDRNRVGHSRMPMPRFIRNRQAENSRTTNINTMA